MRVTVLLVLFATLAGAALLSAGGSSSSNEDLEHFTGRIAVKGTEPHTFVSFTTDDGTEYRLRGEPMPASLEVVSFSVR